MLRVVRSTAAMALAAAAISPASAEILVGTFADPGRVSVFADDADGNAAPLRTISGPVNTKLGYANAFGFDPTRLELFVSDFQNKAIRVYDVRASGDVAPLRTITSSGLGQPRDLVVDVDHQELIVITYLNFVTTYPLQSNGSAFAIRQIDREGAAGSQTRLTNPTGLALIRATDELAVGDLDQPGGVGPASGEILFFSRTANSSGAPARELRGAATELGTYVVSLALDESRSELYVLVGTQLEDRTEFHIAVFDALASGNTAPLRVIRGDHVTLDYAGGIAFDATHDRVLASVGYGGAVPRVLAWPREADGNIAPLTTIAGDQTQLNQPAGVLAIAIPDVVFASSFEDAN